MELRELNETAARPLNAIPIRNRKRMSKVIDNKLGVYYY